MKDAPAFVGIAALLGDQARASMLNTLMSGDARTASELATAAGITRQTASSHLAKLVDAQLVSVVSQGRHKYFRLAAPDIAAMLESVMGVAQRTRKAQALPGPRDPALRHARQCYDHLAGELAVEAYETFVERGYLRLDHPAASSDTLSLTAQGRDFFEDAGVDLTAAPRSRRAQCRPCLDWSERRYHLAGSLGKAILEFIYRERWAKPSPDSRVVRFSARGEAQFRAMFEC